MTTQTTRPASGSTRFLWALIPLVAFGALAAMFGLALYSGDPSKLPSALVGKAAPQTSFGPLDGLTRAGQQVPGITARRLKGGVTVVNFWASWCGPCIAEHPQILALSKLPDVSVLGVNYKDEARAAKRFISRHGNPYHALGVDPSGRGAIEWGVTKLPETFVVNAQGNIIYKHTGPISHADLNTKLVPVVKAAQQ